MTTDHLKRFYARVHASGGEGGPGQTRPAHYPRDRWEACLRTVQQHLSGGAVLEVGAGDGRIAEAVLRLGIPFSRYVLTELIGDTARVRASDLGDGRVEFMEWDVDAGPGGLAGQRFDFIILNAVLEHLVDPIAALRTCRGLLAPGGCVYVDTPNIAKYTRRLKLLAGFFPATASRDEGLESYWGGPVTLHDEGHLHYWTFRSLELMATRHCGFRTATRVPYFLDDGHLPLPVRARDLLARAMPTLFSELALLLHP